ncbi:MAG: hypothetical protein LN411_02460, partial [Candidatus Thermoplasmatota archaeon]|nr:hypothetical protein [Candidatus Thermoplasmatota archaeon]
QDVTRFETGLSWGSVVEVKVNIVQRLRRELSRKCEGVYGVGTVTDPYQPLEARHELTRGCLSILKRSGARTSILTKSNLVLRDMDILSEWPDVEVGLSVGTVDEIASSVIEPGAPPPESRFETLRKLVDSGISVYLMAAPIIPTISDAEPSLRRLVELADLSGVKRIMWDGWNPKPIAKKRLEASVSNSALMEPIDGARRLDPVAASVLRAECRSRGIDLIDAF